MLLALRSTRLEIAKAEGDAAPALPTELLVCPWGAVDIQDRTIHVNAATVAQLPGNQAKARFDDIALDFNHNTVEGTKWYRGEPCLIAAYAQPHVVEGRGIVVDKIRWTPEGEKFIGGRHYLDLSPTVKLNDAGEVIFLHSVAFCRQGQIENLHAAAADPFPGDNNPTPKDKTMDYKALLMGILGLSADATDEQIQQALDAKKAKEADAAAAAAPGPELKDLHLLRADIADAKQKQTAMEQELLALRASGTKAERERIREKAIAEGKVIPLAALEGEQAISNEQLAALVAGLPVSVPVGRRTPEHIAALAAASPGADALDGISRQLGVTPELRAKYSK